MTPQEELLIGTMADAIEGSRECGPHTGHTYSVIVSKAAEACAAISTQHAAQANRELLETQKRVQQLE